MKNYIFKNKIYCFKDQNQFKEKNPLNYKNQFDLKKFLIKMNNKLIDCEDILNLLENCDDDSSNFIAPLPTPYRISTHTLICKLYYKDNPDEFIRPLFHNLAEGLETDDELISLYACIKDPDTGVITIYYKGLAIIQKLKDDIKKEKQIEKEKHKKKETQKLVLKKKKRKAFGNQLSVKIKARNSIIDIKIFSNGRFQMTRVRSIDDAKLATNIFINKIKNLEKSYRELYGKNNNNYYILPVNNIDNIEIKDYQIVMVRCGFDSNFLINRVKLHKKLLIKYHIKSESPNNYRGIIITYFYNPNISIDEQDGICHCNPKCSGKNKGNKSCKKIKFSVFRTGKIDIITKGNDYKILLDASYNAITKILKTEFANIRMDDEIKNIKAAKKTKTKTNTKTNTKIVKINIKSNNSNENIITLKNAHYFEENGFWYLISRSNCKNEKLNDILKKNKHLNSIYHKYNYIYIDKLNEINQNPNLIIKGKKYINNLLTT